MWIFQSVHQLNKDQPAVELLLLHPQRVIVSGKRGLLEETSCRSIEG